MCVFVFIYIYVPGFIHICLYKYICVQTHNDIWTCTYVYMHIQSERRNEGKAWAHVLIFFSLDFGIVNFQVA